MTFISHSRVQVPTVVMRLNVVVFVRGSAQRNESDASKWVNLAETPEEARRCCSTGNQTDTVTARRSLITKTQPAHMRVHYQQFGWLDQLMSQKQHVMGSLSYAYSGVLYRNVSANNSICVRARHDNWKRSQVFSCCRVPAVKFWFTLCRSCPCRVCYISINPRGESSCFQECRRSSSAHIGALCYFHHVRDADVSRQICLYYGKCQTIWNMKRLERPTYVTVYATWCHFAASNSPPFLAMLQLLSEVWECCSPWSVTG